MPIWSVPSISSEILGYIESSVMCTNACNTKCASLLHISWWTLPRKTSQKNRQVFYCEKSKVVKPREIFSIKWTKLVCSNLCNTDCCWTVTLYIFVNMGWNLFMIFDTIFWDIILGWYYDILGWKLSKQTSYWSKKEFFSPLKSL